MGTLNNIVSWIWGIGSPRANTPGPVDDFWYAPPGSKTGVGIRVTPDIALKASAVYACIKILSETIGSIPIQVYRKLPNGGKEPAGNHPLDEVIRYQPNNWQTAIEFWEVMAVNAAMMGGAYAEIVPGPRGAVDQLRPLPSSTRTERMRDGTLRFHTTDPFTKQRRILLQEEVFRVPGLSSDGINGLRAVDLASEAIGLGLAADAYAARVFSNNVNIGGYLVHPNKLSPEAQTNLIQRLVERYTGPSNAHRPIILQEGMEFKAASMTGREAQLIEARKWQLTEVARFWRIPLHMLQLPERTPRANVEQDAIDFVKYTVRPWVRRIEQAIRRDLIVAPQVYEAKFNLDALLRGDSKTRAEYFKAALGSGGSPPWLTPQEVRIIEGFNPRPEPWADQLGQGTNPTSGGNSQQQERLPQEAIPQIPELTNEQRAERVLRKEMVAIRKAAMKYAGDREAFKTWVGAFYGGHVSFVMDNLNIPKNAARAYCDHVKAEVLAADNLEALFENWDDDRISTIAETLKAYQKEAA